MQPMRALGLAVSVLAISAGTVWAASGSAIHIERQSWTFGGMTGQYDKAQLQRGFKVYQEVCAACHSLSQVRFRNLNEPGGPEFAIEGVKTLAAEWANQIETPDLADDGTIITRVPLVSDPMVGPFRNEKAARAAFNGAYPPDLSLITKARTIDNHDSWPLHILQMAKDTLFAYQEAGSDYTYALLIGYKDKPADFELSPGMSYNDAFPGHQIAMTPPLSDGSVEYLEDGEKAPEGVIVPKATLQQNAKDVTAFLSWAADPSLNTRKQIGWQVMIYLLITTVLLYLGKKKIWARAKG